MLHEYSMRQCTTYDFINETLVGVEVEGQAGVAVTRKSLLASVFCKPRSVALPQIHEPTLHTFYTSSTTLVFEIRDLDSLFFNKDTGGPLGGLGTYTTLISPDT